MLLTTTLNKLLKLSNQGFPERARTKENHELIELASLRAPPCTGQWGPRQGCLLTLEKPWVGRGTWWYYLPPWAPLETWNSISYVKHRGSRENWNLVGHSAVDWTSPSGESQWGKAKPLWKKWDLCCRTDTVSHLGGALSLGVGRLWLWGAWIPSSLQFQVDGDDGL